MLRLDFSDHTDRSILLWLADRIEHHFNRLDAQMTALSDRLDALQSAEQDLATRIGTLTGPTDDLKAQLSNLREQYAQLSIDDAQARQAYADLLADADASATRIQAVTDEIKALAPNPDVPVDTSSPTDGAASGDGTEPTSATPPAESTGVSGDATAEPVTESPDTV